MQSDNIQRFALALTKWVGSPSSIVAHTIFFILSFAAAYFGFIELNSMLLVVTTIVSLEAIYLAIFIQMTINLQAKTIQAVEKDIDEIQEDVEEIAEDVGEIAEDVDEIQEDVDELQEDVEDIEESDTADERRTEEQKRLLEIIQNDIQKLLSDLERAHVAHAPTPARTPSDAPAAAVAALPKKPAAKKKAKKIKVK